MRHKILAGNQNKLAYMYSIFNSKDSRPKSFDLICGVVSSFLLKKRQIMIKQIHEEMDFRGVGRSAGIGELQGPLEALECSLTVSVRQMRVVSGIEKMSTLSNQGTLV